MNPAPQVCFSKTKRPLDSVNQEDDHPVKAYLEKPLPTSKCRDHPNQFFDRIFIINLDRCPDRWNRVTRNLLEHGIVNFERQRGICLPRGDPVDILPASYYSQLEAYGGRFKFDANYTLNCVGTNLAHQAIVQKAAARGYRRILVLEDDVFLAHQALARFRQAVDTLRREPWQLLYLGYKRSRSSFPTEPLRPRSSHCPSSELVRPKQFIRGAYGYALHHSIFPLLLQKPPYGGTEIDAFFEFVLCKRARVLCFRKPIIFHRDGMESTITQAKWKRRDF